MSGKTLHVVRCYPRRPPCAGGMEKHIAALSREQRKLGVRVTDVYNEGEVEGDSIRLLPKIRLHHIRSNLIRDLVFYASAIIRLRCIRNTNERIALHIHGDWSAFLLARILMRMIGAEILVASIHGKVYRLHLLKWALSGANLVFSTGRSLVSSLPGVRHLPSAPDDIFFGEPGEAPPTDVILVGNLFNVKNYDLLLDIAKDLRSVSFTVIGTGPEESRLHNAAAKRKITNINWRGGARAEVVRDALAASKIFLNLSHEEGSPTAAMEAMAVGTPVILTPSNDYSTLLGEGKAGIVLNGWDRDHIVNTLRDLLQDKERRVSMGVRARALATNQRWQKKARQVTDAMEQALNRTSL